MHCDPWGGIRSGNGATEQRQTEGGERRGFEGGTTGDGRLVMHGRDRMAKGALGHFKGQVMLGKTGRTATVKRVPCHRWPGSRRRK